MSTSLHGKSFVAGVLVEGTAHSFQATSPLTNQPLEPSFSECGAAEVNRALTLAEEAFASYRKISAEARAVFLETIAEEILALGDVLLERTNLETGLPLERLTRERGRTVNQLRLFASVVREGSWVDARIDPALPNRAPLPRPDLRRMLLPLGPVVVFGASNFPLAFSVAGGDTASALAAGCPVVVKAHPAHPGASELVARAITKAAERCELHPGVFSLLHGNSAAIGQALAQHPLTKAVGFTGSHKAGRALFNAAAARAVPIPVFAEMSSINPLFILPGALNERKAALAEGLKGSVTMGVGQFCTKPGLVLGLGGPDWDDFAGALATAVRGSTPGTMLHGGIAKAYTAALEHTVKLRGVTPLATADAKPDAEKTQAEAVVFTTDTESLLRQTELRDEIFGPYTLLASAGSMEELIRVAEALAGQLTATLHGTAEDLAAAAPLVAVLERKVGRLIVNGYPTGVEVAPAMHHGGPYPATTDERFTSVGTAAIQRWARPVCYQAFPAALLPEELQDGNPRGIMRQVEGVLTRDGV